MNPRGGGGEPVDARADRYVPSPCGYHLSEWEVYVTHGHSNTTPNLITATTS